MIVIYPIASSPILLDDRVGCCGGLGAAIVDCAGGLNLAWLMLTSTTSSSSRAPGRLHRAPHLSILVGQAQNNWVLCSCGAHVDDSVLLYFSLN